ncbi:MAG TPA: glucose 1-dehydrogenase [Roseimicrobium sp.]|nr:glucose 1-dehydrogenase [Roseimicrobium sp.]
MSSPKMRAIGVVPSKREVRLLEHEMPRITRATQVRIRTLDVGICGTDREICTFVYGEPPKGFDYLVLGHESLGQVLEVGADVKNLKVGDLVVPSVRRPCAHENCEPCKAERQDYCSTGNYIERGIKSLHGYMAEYYVEDEQFLNFVPQDLRDVAVMTEPLTIAEKGLQQVWQVQKRLPWASSIPGKPPGHGLKAVVLGAGPIGILGTMALLVRGFDTYVYSRSKAPNVKSDLVNSLGAKYISSLEVTPAQLAEQVGNIDLVYEAVGGSRVSFDVMEVLGVNGIFVFTGIPAPGKKIEIDGEQLMRNIVLKNQAIVGTVNADRESFQNAIADLGEFKRRWPKQLESMITGRFAPDHYLDLLVGKNTGIKNVIRFAN